MEIKEVGDKMHAVCIFLRVFAFFAVKVINFVSAFTCLIFGMIFGGSHQSKTRLYKFAYTAILAKIYRARLTMPKIYVKIYS